MINPATILENQAHLLIESVLAGNRSEDDHWEIKRQWPSPDTCYRSLAAQANAARGEPIKWLIGLDEKNKSFTDVGESELANWYPQLVKHFEDGVAPQLMCSRRVNHDSKHLFAAQFATDEAPYVTRIPDGDRYEVPWRQGNGTRSAKRRELLQILLPTTSIPIHEPILASLGAIPKGDKHIWTLTAVVYVAAREPCTIPRHRIRIGVENLDTAETREVRRCDFYRAGHSQNHESFLLIQHEQLYFSGPAQLIISSTWNSSLSDPFPERFDVRIELPVLAAEASMIVKLRFPGPYQRTTNGFAWRAVDAAGTALPPSN
jgi:hypothetical protein